MARSASSCRPRAPFAGGDALAPPRSQSRSRGEGCSRSALRSETFRRGNNLGSGERIEGANAHDPRVDKHPGEEPRRVEHEERRGRGASSESIGDTLDSRSLRRVMRREGSAGLVRPRAPGRAMLASVVSRCGGVAARVFGGHAARVRREACPTTINRPVQPRARRPEPGRRAPSWTCPAY